MLIYFYYWIWTGKYCLERLSKMEDMYVFHINPLVPLFRTSLFRVVLSFYISIYGSGHRRYSVKKCILKNFANFTGKHLCWSLFLLKRYSNIDVFLWNLRSFQEHLFWRISANDCFWIYRGYCALPWNDLKETYKWKNRFSRWQRV